jgi:hypothetical protein
MAADTGVSKALKSANPKSKDRNPAGAGLSFSVHSSGDAGIAHQPDRKIPIRNPARLC